jgi:DnaJ-class molecular chaperone
MESLIRLIDERLKQHRDNLAGWSEGQTCGTCYGIGRIGIDQDPYINQKQCPVCRGEGVKPGTKGYLLPTEPEPEERQKIRDGLKAAIDELEWVKAQIVTA